MVGFREAIVDNIGQGLCNVTSAAEFTAQLGSRFYGSIGQRGASQTSEQAAQLWGNAAGIFCDRPPQDIPGEFDRQFDGGQCDGILYDISYVIDIFNPNSGQTSPLGVNTAHFGPLGPISVIDGGNGTEILASPGPGQPQQVLQDQTYGPGFVVSNIRNVSPVRRDGQPDNCGNQPGTLPEYDPSNFTVPRTIDYDDENGNPQSEPVDITYRPVTLDNNNNFSVPVSITFGDGSSLFGDVNIDTGDIVIGPGNDGGDGNSGGPTELDPGEEPSEGEVVIGVRVSSTVDNLSTARVTELQFINNNLNIYVPRLATVTFLYEDSFGQSLGETTDVKLLSQIVYADRPAVSVEVVPRNGVLVVWSLIVVPENQGCCT